MSKLCQIIALEKGAKQRANKETGEIHKEFQKSAMYTGRSKTYTPLDADDTDTQNDEIVNIQKNLDDDVDRIKEVLSELWDIVIMKDVGNQEASAAIMIDGEPVTAELPATSLVFLEKQLDDVHTMIKEMPTLSAAHKWVYDEDAREYRSEEIVRNRTKKVSKPIVLYDATPDHPAQTQLITEDAVVGHYKEYLTASALSKRQQKELLDRVHKMKQAVKEARERANSTQVKDFKGEGKKILNFIFGKSLVAN